MQTAYRLNSLRTGRPCCTLSVLHPSPDRLRSATSLLCPGSNGYHQLGSEGGGEQYRPVLISDAGTSVYKAVSCGSDHTCALRDDGRVVCFGANNHGQVSHTTQCFWRGWELPSSLNEPVPGWWLSNVSHFQTLFIGMPPPVWRLKFILGFDTHRDSRGHHLQAHRSGRPPHLRPACIRRPSHVLRCVGCLGRAPASRKVIKSHAESEVAVLYCSGFADSLNRFPNVCWMQATDQR